MKIFVIGNSGVGKTPLSKEIENRYGFKYISASRKIKTLIPSKILTLKKIDRKKYTNEITAFSLSLLRKDPFIIINDLRMEDNVVIDGIRNPRDFINLFNPNKDKVVFVSKEKTEIKSTIFEKGIIVIKEYIKWLEENNLLENKSIYIDNIYPKEMKWYI